MTRRIRLSALVLLIAAAAMSASAQPVDVETITEDLRFPHAIAFLPSGDMLITEEEGAIAVVRDGRLLEERIANVPKPYVSQLSGLNDIILDPAFEATRQIYISYARGEAEPWTLVVEKATLTDGALQDRQAILEVVPSAAGEKLWGGYLTFLPDDTLLVAVADGGDTREQAQRLDSILGKMVRIDKDGKTPSDNPFVGRSDALPELYTYGHRHIIGLHYDPVQDVVFANENGPYGGDEVNVLQAGANYGWPIATYGMDYSGAYITPFQSYPGTEQPVLYWDPSIAPSGMTQCRGCQWPEWEGDLITGALSGQKIVRIEMDGTRAIAEHDLLAERRLRIRDVEFGPDGALYVITDAAKGTLFRLTPANSAE